MTNFRGDFITQVYTGNQKWFQNYSFKAVDEHFCQEIGAFIPVFIKDLS